MYAASVIQVHAVLKQGRCLIKVLGHAVSLLVISLVDELQQLSNQSCWYNLILCESGQHSAKQRFVPFLTNRSGFACNATL